MERLEAALEKAREKRQETATIVEAPVALTPEARVKGAPLDPWAMLREVKFSTRAARNNRITTLTTGKLSGAYDMLRSRTLRLMGENKWSRVAITSPNMNCGKTTVCANLAFSLARQTDLKVLVMDMDMRRPSLNKVLSIKEKRSLHHVIEGKAEVNEQFLRYGSNLAFALNYQPANHPSELLQSNRTKEFLNEMEELFKPDIMVFDMPPLLASDDNVGFLSNVDCGLLIGAAEETSITQLDNCEKELAELTNVLGVVLNKCRYVDSDNGYDYDYY